MKILTTDIAFRNLGWAVLDRHEIVDYGTIMTVKGKSKTVAEDRVRCGVVLAEGLKEIITKHDVEGIVGELPSGSQSAGAANCLGLASGIVVATGISFGIPMEFISEGNSKFHTFGRRKKVSKNDVMAWCRDEYPKINFPVTKNKANPKFEHVADALMAYAGLRKVGNLISDC